MSPAASFPAALRLVYVVDAAASRRAAHVEAALAGGVTCLWLRDPAATGRSLFDAAEALLGRCRERGAALLVGDRPDVALALGADGVQLGHRALPPARVRSWYDGWMGVSCHDAAEVAAAEAAGADHVVLSPVFPVPGKGTPLGVAGLARLAGGTRLPAVALGGIDVAKVATVRGVPVAGVAVLRALLGAEDVEAAARVLSAP